MSYLYFQLNISVIKRLTFYFSPCASPSNVCVKRTELTFAEKNSCDVQVLWQMPLLWWHTDLCHLWCATTTVTGLLMLSFHDLHCLRLWRLPSTVPCSMTFAAYCDGRHGRTMITCDTWQQLTVRTDGQLGYWPVSICIRLFCVLNMMCQASSCSISFQRLGIANPSSYCPYS